MSKFLNSLLNIAYDLSIKRVQKKNIGNGYAYLTCIVFDKKKPYYVLQYWNKSL